MLVLKKIILCILCVVALTGCDIRLSGINSGDMIEILATDTEMSQVKWSRWNELATKRDVYKELAVSNKELSRRGANDIQLGEKYEYNGMYLNRVMNVEFLMVIP